MNFLNPYIFIPLIIEFVAVVFFTPFVRKTLISANITDNPIVSENSHKQGTPTMGGLAIILGLVLICIYSQNQILLITTGVMIAAAIIGLFDDLLGLKTKEIQSGQKRNITGRGIRAVKLQPGEARVASKAKKMLIN